MLAFRGTDQTLDEPGYVQMGTNTTDDDDSLYAEELDQVRREDIGGSILRCVDIHESVRFAQSRSYTRRCRLATVDRRRRARYVCVCTNGNGTAGPTICSA